MDLFNSNKKKTTKADKAEKSVSPAVVSAKKVEFGAYQDVIRAPWLSEKALIGTENGVYVFEIPSSTNKTEIAAAVQHIYGVTPRQVRVVNLPAKRKALRTRRGFGSRAARHKAYVYLKKGDNIQFA